MAKGKVTVSKGRGGVHPVVWIAAGILALGAIGPSAAHGLGEMAGKGGADAAGGAASAAAGALPAAAAGVCPPGLTGLRCALPASSKGLDVDPRTTVTTLPPRVPYPAPNGPVRPLPSQTPVAPPIGTGGQPKIGTGGSDLPKLGEAPSGGILGDIPAIGPAAEGIIKAIGPAVPG